jgi:hypothetical protein
MTTCENEAAPPHPSSKKAANIVLGAECLFSKEVKVIVVGELQETPSTLDAKSGCRSRVEVQSLFGQVADFGP